MNLTCIKENLDAAKIVFWDFDGVIKESVAVKTAAFHELFLPYGEEVASRVRDHHLANGGMSRFRKIPLYLSWAGLSDESTVVEDFCARFADVVEDGVVASNWVSGVRECLLRYHKAKTLILVTATPKAEIDSIVRRLSIEHYFDMIYGAPTSKAAAIRQTLQSQGIEEGNAAVMIGDSGEDMKAASECGIRFLLRRTAENLVTLPGYSGPYITNFE